MNQLSTETENIEEIPESTSKKRKISSSRIEKNSKEDRVQRMIQHISKELDSNHIVDYISLPVYLETIEIDVKIQKINFKSYKVFVLILNFPWILQQRRLGNQNNAGNIVIKEEKIQCRVHDSIESAVRDTTVLIENLNSDNSFFKSEIYPFFLDSNGNITECQNCTEFTAHTRCDICRSGFCVFCLSKYIKKMYRDESRYFDVRKICQCHQKSNFHVDSYECISQEYNNVKEWETFNTGREFNFFDSEGDIEEFDFTL